MHDHGIFHKSPAFQFYAQRFVADVQHLEGYEIGGYILLICYAWEHWGIPKDLRRASNIAKVPRSYSDRFWAEIGPLWKPHPICAECLISPRLEEVREASRLFSERQRANGRRGGRPNNNPRVNPEETHGLAKHKPKPNPNESSPVSSLQSPKIRPTAAEPGKSEKTQVPPADLEAYLILDAVYPVVVERHPDLGMSRDKWRKSNKAAALDLAAAGHSPDRVVEVLRLAYAHEFAGYHGIVMLDKLSQHWASLVATKRKAPTPYPAPESFTVEDLPAEERAANLKRLAELGLTMVAKTVPQ